MTKREFLNAVIAGTITDEMVEFATEDLAKLDAQNERRRAKNDEKAEALKPFIDKFVGYLGDEPLTASDIAEKFVADGVERPDGKDVNVQWVSSLGGKVVKFGLGEKVDVKVPKKGVQKGYIAC